MTKFTITENEIGERLDSILARRYPEYSRSYFASLIKEGQVSVNDVVHKPSFCPKIGDQIYINFAEVSISDRPEAEDIPLDIIFEDQNVIVVNKQPGLVVHPAAGNQTGTLVNALIHHFPRLADVVQEEGSALSLSRPGLVHRLDKDTSGLIIVAKNPRAMHSLSKQIQNRTVNKIYLALLFGWPKKESGEITSYLGRNPKDRKQVADVGPTKGRLAISHYHVLKYLETNLHKKVALVEFDIKTGRTHQIRVQAKSMNTPVLGDQIYNTKESLLLGRSLKATRQLLHSYKLTVQLLDKNKVQTFIAPVPDDLKQALAALTEVC